MTPRSVIGGRVVFGFDAAMALLTGPGFDTEWFVSPFKVCALVCARPTRAPIVVALKAAAAAPKKERRLMEKA